MLSIDIPGVTEHPTSCQLATGLATCPVGCEGDNVGPHGDNVQQLDPTAECIPGYGWWNGGCFIKGGT